MALASFFSIAAIAVAKIDLLRQSFIAWRAGAQPVWFTAPGGGRLQLWPHKAAFDPDLGLLLGALPPTLVAVLAFRLLWVDWSAWAWWERGLRLAVMVGAGGALYGGLLYLQGIRPRDLRGH